MDVSFLEKQYKYSIDARDKLNENYHKWMTYFYIANAGIIVAISSIFKESQTNISLLFLSLIGIFISIIWNLSCKGYYYWSLSWIDIIKRFEELMTTEENTFAVYSIFSKEVADSETGYLIPTKPANISTPKLTLIFSLFSILCWVVFSVFQFYLHVNKSIFLTVTFSIFISIFIIIIYKSLLSG